MPATIKKEVFSFNLPGWLTFKAQLRDGSLPLKMMITRGTRQLQRVVIQAMHLKRPPTGSDVSARGFNF
jgi:hypothetical protein